MKKQFVTLNKKNYNPGIMPGTFFNTLKNKSIAFAKSTDLVLLVFLVLILNVSLVIKLAGLLFIYALRPNFRFNFFTGRVPLFYIAMVIYCIAEYALNFNQSKGYVLPAVTLGFWGVSFLIIHQLKLAIEKNGIKKVENALVCFFILNALVSFYNLALIIKDSNSVNPYMFEGLSYKYFASTGDYIRGVMFDVCTANMIINSFALFYFMYLQRYILSFICFVVILLTTSNLGNIILVLFLLYVLIVHKNRLYKSIMLCYLGALIVFMVKVSPANLEYLSGTLKKLDAHKTDQQKVEQTKHRALNSDSLMGVYIDRKNYHPQPLNTSDTINPEVLLSKVRNTINSSSYEQNRTIDSSFEQHGKTIHEELMSFCKSLYGDSLTSADIPFMHNAKTPGKWVAWLQTIHYISQSPKKFMFGAGPGNFSSKLTFRAVGLNTDGSWPKKYRYVANDFKNDHLKLWLYYKIQPTPKHSIINYPNSVANQLPGEYGLIGVLLFIFYYLWYFVKRYKFLSYGRIILPLLLVFLLTDYWFENLSIMIIFEIMMLLDIYKKEADLVK